VISRSAAVGSLQAAQQNTVKGFIFPPSSISVQIIFKELCLAFWSGSWGVGRDVESTGESVVDMGVPTCGLIVSVSHKIALIASITALCQVM